MEWGHSGSPRSKNFRLQKSAGKILASIFLDQDGILLIDYLPRGQTINAEYYSSLLVQLKNILKEKRRGKFPSGFLFLHNNTPAPWELATQKKLAYLGFQCLNHPTYSPDLAPSDYHLFPGLEKKTNWKVAIVRPTRRLFLPRRPGLTDNLLIFLIYVHNTYIHTYIDTHTYIHTYVPTDPQAIIHTGQIGCGLLYNTPKLFL